MRNWKVGPDDLAMEVEILGQEILLEFSANDDLIGFRMGVEEEGFDVNMSGLWYGRRIGSKTMGYEERTPLMVASAFGSKLVASYILGLGCVDVNRVCGSDGATALHCAAAGGSAASLDVVKLLLDSSADSDSVDANGKRPADLIPSSCRFAPRKRKMMLEHLLKGSSDEFGKIDEKTNVSRDGGGGEKKEYPVDPSLPDIKNGIYGTDEFRMYMFKVKPCSRAYSHDWTECPFVHPGENARRRDPRKYHYSCVPCPDFRKGTCQRGDACEYSHGIFECWLHPAQYRTRMCKDELSCNRRVCFFAHKPEELRPFYASTGVTSPRSSYNLGAASPLDIASISPLALGSPTSPVTPSGASGASSPMRPNQLNPTTPAPQFLCSRLKTTLNARDMDLDAGLTGLDHLSLAAAAFGSDRSGEFGRHAGLSPPANLDDIFGTTLDPSIMSRLQSPKGMQMRQNMNQALLSSFHLSSSPGRTTSSFRMDPSNGVLNSKSAAFTKRSQSFVDRGVVTSSPISSPIAMPSTLSGWGSPDGKLDWGFKKEEHLGKFRKSASFGIRSSVNSSATSIALLSIAADDEPDVLWAPAINSGMEDQQYRLNNRGVEMHPAWVEQLYMDQEQIVA